MSGAITAPVTGWGTGWGTPEQCIEWATRARRWRARAAEIKAGAPSSFTAAQAAALARDDERRVRMAADAFMAEAARRLYQVKATYTPPAAGHDGHEMTLEPARFGRTGAGLIRTSTLRDGFHDEAMAYSLDAPTHVPSGSVEGGLQRLLNPKSTVPPWHYLSTSVARERS